MLFATSLITEAIRFLLFAKIITFVKQNTTKNTKTQISFKGSAMFTSPQFNE